MPRHRRIGLFMSNSGFQAFQDSTKRKEVHGGDRSGETGLLLKDTVYTDFPRSSPLSFLARSLRAPQTHTQNPAASLSREETKKKNRGNSVDDLEKMQLFQLVFLSDDEDQSVEVEEVEEINFAEVRARLEDGYSIFITRKENEKVDTAMLDREALTIEAERPWYVAHV